MRLPQVGKCWTRTVFPIRGIRGRARERAKIARAALAAAKAAGIEVEEGGICLVGDTPFDVAAGKALGVPVIGVAAGKFGEKELLESGATRTAADYSDLDTWMGWLGDTFK